MKRASTVIIVAVAASGCVSAPAVASSQDVLIALGALRQQHGLPGVSEDANLSAGCRALMAHRQANNGTVGNRAEWPEAARVLSWWVDPTGWGNGGSRPTAQYPNSDAGLLDPTMTKVGVSDGCLGFTWEQPAGPASEQLVTFPGEGSTGTPYAVTAWKEFPEGNLSQFLGGPATTGPYIRVFAWGGAFARIAPGLVAADVSGALVDGRGHPVSVRTGANGRLAGWSRVGTAVMVPTEPLRPREWYRATMSYAERNGTARAARTWQFRTAGLDPETAASVSGTGELEVFTSSPATLRVRLAGDGRTRTLGPFGRGRASVPMPVEPGQYRICLEQAAVGPYDGAERCDELSQSWAAPVRLRARRLRAGRIEVRATAPAVAAGLSVRLHVVGYRTGNRWMRVGKGATLRGTLGTRSARWVLSGRTARRAVSAVRVSAETGARATSAGQGWIRLRRQHEVRVTRR